MRTTKEALEIQRRAICHALAQQDAPVREILDSTTLTDKQRVKYCKVWQSLNEEYQKLVDFMEEVN